MPNQPATKHRQVRLSDELWAALDEAAKANGTNKSEIIRKLVVGYLRRQRRRPTDVPWSRDRGE